MNVLSYVGHVFGLYVCIWFQFFGHLKLPLFAPLVKPALLSIPPCLSPSSIPAAKETKMKKID